MLEVTEALLQYNSFKEKWNTWLESGDVVEITKFCKEFDVRCKVIMTKELFSEVFPYAEEAVKSILFQERLEEMFKKLKRSADFGFIDCVNFNLHLETNIKKVHSYDEIETIAHGKKKDKVVSVFAGRIVDDKGKPAIVFGIANDNKS